MHTKQKNQFSISCRNDLSDLFRVLLRWNVLIQKPIPWSKQISDGFVF